MAKKNKVTMGDPGDGAPEPDRRSPMERAAEKEEMAILDLLNGEQVNDATIELKRRGVAQTIFAHLVEIPAKGFSQENVKRVFGGGDYKARVRFAKSGTFGPQFEFTIDHAIPSIYPTTTKTADTSREDRTPELVTALTAAMKSAMPPPPPAPDNSLLMLLIKQQGEQTLAMLTRPAPSADAALTAQLAELRAELRSLKENGGGNRGGGDFQKTLENARMLIELTGGSGGDTPAAPDRVSELIKALAPAVAPLVQRMLGAPGADPATMPLANGAQPLLPAGAVAGTGTARTVTATTENQPVEDMSVLVQLFLPEFKRLAMQAAAKGRDAFEWADSKLDDIDPKYHDEIFKLANAEDWSAKLFGPEVAASPHFAWLLEMRNAILTRMFVADVTNAAKTNPPVDPTAYAGAFLDRASVSYHDALFNLTDPEAWKQIFEPYAAGLDAAWLENVRLAFEKELGADDETEAPAAEPAAAPATDPVARENERRRPIHVSPRAARAIKKTKPTAAPKKKK